MTDLSAVLETALDAVVVMNPDGLVADWNSCAEGMFGWLREEAVGRPMADLIIPPALRDAHWRGLSRYLATGEAVILRQRVEVVAVRKDGREIPIELAITPTRTDGALQFLGFLRDISERRLAEAALDRRAREAELLFRMTTLAAETDSYEEALASCLDTVCEVTGWPVGHAFVRGAAGPDLVPTMIWRHQGEDRYAALRAATQDMRFAPGEGLPGRILAAGRPQWIADVDQDPNFVRGQAVRDLGVKAAFGFPIKTRGEVVAVLEFFSLTRADPDPELLTTVRTLGEQVGRVLERKKLDEQQRLLLDELNHRVKNTLVTVQSLAAQTARSSSTLADFQERFAARLLALAEAHDLLTARKWRDAELGELLRRTLAAFDPERDRVTIEGPPVRLSPNAAITVNLALHELATNAAKYGALSAETGRVEVRWSLGGGVLDFVWRESGLDRIEPPARQGFGSRLLTAVARELGAEVRPEHTPHGVGYHWRVPLSAKISAAAEPVPAA